MYSFRTSGAFKISQNLAYLVCMLGHFVKFCTKWLLGCILKTTWPQLGPAWLQLGPNLAPTWPHHGPKFGQLVRILAQLGPILVPTWPHLAPLGLNLAQSDFASTFLTDPIVFQANLVPTWHAQSMHKGPDLNGGAPVTPARVLDRSIPLFAVQHLLRESICKSQEIAL